MKRIIATLLVVFSMTSSVLADEIILTPEQVDIINKSVETGEKVDIIIESQTKQPDFMKLKVGTYEYIKAVKKFQAMNNLPVTGKYDDLTKRNVEENIVAYDKIDPTKVPYKLIVVINKETNIMTIYEGRLPIDKFPVSTGTSNQTPTMKTTIKNKAVNPAWGGLRGKYKPTKGGASNNPLGKRWMALDNKGLIGIHGTLEENWIGRHRTQGCIRMFNSDIEQVVFPKLPIGTEVWVGNTKDLETWGIQQLNNM